MRRMVTITLCAAGMACNPYLLDGDWSGEVDCGDAGSVPTSLDISAVEPWTYEADGEMSEISLGGPVRVQLSGELRQTSRKGAQDLDADFTCQKVDENSGAASAMDCSSFDLLSWDGGDLLGAELDGFLQDGLSCTMELERD